ncbi:hypothetical protein IPA_00080 [Ignicoccus pacificus DSM 13166]|uniref:Uncharacterized protein n=1 Tax=Ignicoccus pacificus DSM 13166 TaxID=940294 RepID=A0A977KAA5_9CREN|nr:hypothetical protein IPA_00080 [Ignicoccus pacificus DSM 13166]
MNLGVDVFSYPSLQLRGVEMKKGVLISILGVDITLGGLLLILAYLLQTVLSIVATMYLQHDLRKLQALVSAFGGLG